MVLTKIYIFIIIFTRAILCLINLGYIIVVQLLTYKENEMRLIASDLDGTLLDDRGQISAKNASAIKKAIDSGLYFAAATGRSLQAASIPLREAGITCPIISLNGAMIFDERGKLMHSVEMERDSAKKVLSVCRPVGMYLEFFTNKGIFSVSREHFLEVLVDIMLSANPELSEEEIRANAHLRFQFEPVEFIDSYESIFTMSDVRIYKILAFHTDKEKLDEVRDVLQNETGLTVTSSGAINLEFNHSEAQKGIALERLANHLDVPMKDVVALGDNWNDVSMLQTAGIGIAMGNAAEEIKRLADKTTKSNVEDGVAEIIEEILHHEELKEP